MKLGPFPLFATGAICALIGLACPAVAHADLVLPPEPSSAPASSPPPVDPAVEGNAAADEPAGARTDPTAEPTDPTSSVQGPPSGGCASCRVGEPDSESGVLPLLVAVAAVALAFTRRR
jgi:MYXO-CTERM domain-containing protein